MLKRIAEICNSKSKYNEIFIQYKYVSNRFKEFLNFYFMKKSGKVEIELLNIQVGCVLRLARLKKGISQLELGLMIDSNPTMIGRIERFESISGWDKIFLISRQLDVDFTSLFKLKKKENLLNIVDQSYGLEDKLTKEKEDYYKSLKELIESKFKLLNK